MGGCVSTANGVTECTYTEALSVAGKAAGTECARLGSELDMSRVPHVEKRSKHSAGDLPDCLGFVCRKGLKPGMCLPNQDSWAAIVAPEAFAAYGVFDGHGERGHLVSDHVRAALLPGVVHACCALGDPTPQVQACYRMAHATVCSSARLGGRASGTTATIVVHDARRSRLVVSHVGDSRAVLLQCVGEDGALVVEDLTRDHKPELEDEGARIRRAGGRVVVVAGCHRVSPRKVYAPGLNMSRSLGDAQSHACGVSAQPEVTVRDISPEDRAVLVASDGVWEVVTSREAAELAHSFAPERAMEAAAKVAELASGRWLKATGGRMVDDITVVLAWLPQSQPGLCRLTTGSTMAPVRSPGLPPSPAETTQSARSIESLDSAHATEVQAEEQ